MKEDKNQKKIDIQIEGLFLESLETFETLQRMPTVSYCFKL